VFPDHRQRQLLRSHRGRSCSEPHLYGLHHRLGLRGCRVREGCGLRRVRIRVQIQECEQHRLRGTGGLGPSEEVATSDLRRLKSDCRPLVSLARAPPPHAVFKLLALAVVVLVAGGPRLRVGSAPPVGKPQPPDWSPERPTNGRRTTSWPQDTPEPSSAPDLARVMMARASVAFPRFTIMGGNAGTCGVLKVAPRSSPQRRQ
jgi:hypothetical protein